METFSKDMPAFRDSYNTEVPVQVEFCESREYTYG
jgi:hypothetical protein